MVYMFSSDRIKIIGRMTMDNGIQKNGYFVSSIKVVQWGSL